MCVISVTMSNVKPGDYIQKDWTRNLGDGAGDFLLVIAVHKDEHRRMGGYVVTYIDMQGKLDWAWDVWFRGEDELDCR